MLKTIKYMYFIHMKVGADDNLMNRRKPLLLISHGDESINEKSWRETKGKRRKKLTKLHVSVPYIQCSPLFSFPRVCVFGWSK